MLASAGLAAAALVASVAAPGLEWHTLHTACCDVHYPRQLEHVARRVAVIADESVKNASDFLKSAPAERVQIVLHDVLDTPNGFTNVVPYDSVDLRTITPESDSELSNTDEYLRLLVQHEIMHIVHLDDIHGFPSVVNLVVGKVWPPNLVQPRFVVEGLAVLAETRFTGGGRLRSTLFSSDLLIAALNGDLWSLDDVSSYSRRNPGGGGAYAYGAELIDWLSRKYGAGIWAAVARDYGGTIIPFAVQRSIEKVTGHSLDDDYRLFLDDVRADAERLRAAAAARGGPTRARRLTRFGGVIHTPRFDDGGALLFGLNAPDQAAGVYAIAGLPGAVPVAAPVLRVNEAADLALLGDTLVLAQTETTRGYYSFHDLWRADLAGGPRAPARGPPASWRGGTSAAGPALRRVTREARLRAPSAVPGTRLVVAEQRSAGSAALVVVDVDTGATRDLVRSDTGTLWYSPDVSPDGARVAASRWTPGGARQVVEIDMAADAQGVHRERVLTDDGAQNLDPAWCHGDDDGWVLFSSDREGLFSIYAVNRVTREVRRIVDSLGLAKAPRPTPDERGVVYVDTHLDGNDLYAAPLDIAHAPVVGPARPAPAPHALTRESTAPAERYNAFPTLVPHYYIPLLATDAAGGTALGLSVVGQDAVGELSFAAQASWGFAVERPHLAASMRFLDSPLPITVSSELRTDRSSRFRRTDGQPDVQQETVLSAGANFSLPFMRSRRYAHSLAIGYNREFHVVENPLTSPPDAAHAPQYPPNRNIGALTLDWGYSGIESYRDSISNERGFTSFLHLRHADRFTFSEVDLTEVSVDARDFVPVPGLGGHVIGLYLQGGVAFGDKRVRSSFFLGGFSDRDITSDLLTGARSGAGVLRGYPRGVVVGDAFTLGTLEYRLPLLEVEHGASTLPLFLDRIHAAAFTDLGMAFDGAPVPTRVLASVGVELRMQVVLAYYGLFFVRIGYARGVSAGGVDQPYAVLGFPY